MAQYTVQAPDGKQITLEGPDGASQADILAQAQKLYQPKAAPVAKPKPAPRKGPNVGDGMESAKVLKVYENARASLVRGISDPEEKRKRLLAFDTDPRAQAMRKNAGLAPVSTRQGEVKKIAKDKGSDFLASFTAGAERNFFGIPERLKAAIHQYLPESTLELAERGGKPIPKGKNYQEQLELERAENAAQRDRSLSGNIAGQLTGAVTAGGLAGKAVVGGARRLAARGVPGANVLQGLGTLHKGQRVRNAAKLVTAGAAGGAAQSAGEGSDITTGAATGAAGAAVLGTGVKVAQIVSRPFRDIFSGMNITPGKADRFLRRLTNMSQDQLERLAAQKRADTGAEPTLFELMSLEDQNKILKTAVVGKDNVVEATSAAIRARAANLGPEMARRATEVLEPQREFIEQGMRRDLTNARGGVLEPGDAELVARAARSPTDLSELRDVEVRAIMAPYDDVPVVNDLEELFPSIPGPGGVPLQIDPEVQAVIRSAAGIMRQRAAGAGVTAGDISDMMSTLRGDLGRGGNEARVAQRAINHLQDNLDQLAPDAGAAARQQTDAYAARSRMVEGGDEGHAQRLRDTIQVGKNRNLAREVRNAYDTAEGTAGRVLGQSNRVLHSLGGSPEEALKATVAMSRNSTGRELAQNIGETEAEAILRAARAQDESAQALASASRQAQSGGGDGADSEMLAQAIVGLHPATFITTKAGSMRKLLDMTYIPENRARTIIDMIFSQDPATVARALRAVGNEPNGAQFMKYLSGVTGMLAGGGAGGIDLPGGGESEIPSVEADLAGMEGPVEDEVAADAELLVDSDSPYAQDLQDVYDNESPELLDLISRVKMQESGGKHFQDDGSVTTSSAGAIGIMQVMPETAPEAAELAGIEWDEDAYINDPVYNELLGIAYLSEQLRKYDGDVEKALAAYNAGPGRVDQVLASGAANWLANLPPETQDYVARIG